MAITKCPQFSFHIQHLKPKYQYVYGDVHESPLTLLLSGPQSSHQVDG